MRYNSKYINCCMKYDLDISTISNDPKSVKKLLSFWKQLDTAILANLYWNNIFLLIFIWISMSLPLFFFELCQTFDLRYQFLLRSLILLSLVSFCCFEKSETYTFQFLRFFCIIYILYFSSRQLIFPSNSPPVLYLINYSGSSSLSQLSMQ